MKVKFGTQLEDSVYEQLKVTAAKEKRSIGEIVQQALADYLQRARPGRGRKTGLSRLLARDPLKISESQFHTSMEEDFYEQ
jgi:Ribbon-helix-helix protein, copG family